MYGVALTGLVVVEKMDVMEVEGAKIQTDENRVLFNHVKLMSKKYRPFCDFCGLVCGVIWYVQKQTGAEGIVEITGSTRGLVGSDKTQKKPVVLCSKCQAQGNFPTVLA